MIYYRCPELLGNGPTRSMPHIKKGHGGAVELRGMDGRWFITPYIWHGLHFLVKSSQSFCIVGQKIPCLTILKAMLLLDT